MKLILQAIKALFQKAETRLDALIPAPKSATVGQMLVVKAVDESGKPTEWGTVDMPEVPEIPEQANADWNQDDSTAPDFVKNRTHYEYHEVIWQHTFTESEENGNYGYYTEGINFVFEIGDTYLIEVDGAEYECTAYEEFGSGYHILDLYSDDIRVQIRSGYNSYVSKLCTLVVKASTPTVHKLDEKFIPDSIARTKDIPETSGGVNHLIVNWTESVIDGKTIYSIDKSFEEVVDAYNKGIIVLLQAGNSRMMAQTCNSSMVAFYDFGIGVINQYVIFYNGNHYRRSAK